MSNFGVMMLIASIVTIIVASIGVNGLNACSSKGVHHTILSVLIGVSILVGGVGMVLISKGV